MKATEEIDRVFFDKKFSAAKYMLRYIVGASEDVRKDQLETISRFRSLADQEIAGVVDSNYSNFNASLGKFNVISNQLQEARGGLVEVSKRSMEGKAILTAKTKNLNELLLLKYESKKVIEVVDDIEYIDKAPAKIRAALSQKNCTMAVDIYLRAFGLVLGEKLAVFHAISNMRNALMECKQLIEDQLVQELESILFLKESFQTFSKGLKQTLPNYQSILQNDTLYESAFHTLKDNKSATSEANPLQELIQAVKRLSREVDVAGTLKNTRGVQLGNVIRQVASICKGKSFYEESKFGRHPASTNFQSYFQLLSQVMAKILQRHYLMTVYLSHSCCTMPDIVQKAFGLIQDQLREYFGEVSEINLSVGSPSLENPEANASGLFRFPQLQAGNMSNQQEHILFSSREQVCPPSLFHAPIVYQDIVSFSVAVQPYCTVSFVDSIFHSYLSKQWIPKLKSEAEQVLAHPTIRVPNRVELNVPMESNYNSADIHVLLHIIDELFFILEKLPPYRQDIASIIELTILRYVEDSSSIVRKICDGTLNQLETGVAATELMRCFQEYPVYIAAKGNVPHQPLAKVKPSDTIDVSHESSSSLSGSSSHGYSVSYSLPTPIITTNSNPDSEPLVRSKKDELQLKEWEFEQKFKDPTFWSSPNVSKGLLFDQGKLAMLAYLNTSCDFVSLHVDKCKQSFLSATDPLLENILGNIKSASWRCSGLADECLFFLRREIRLHAFYFLTQIAQTKLDLSPPTNSTIPPTFSPHDCVVAWNAHLMQLNFNFKMDKMAFLFDGLDRLESLILINILPYVPKISIDGIKQIQVNLSALQQNLTALFYGYPNIPRDFFHFDRAKRYYHLLSLSETELELYLMENRRVFPPESLRAIWRVEVTSRVLSKSSVNKLDSLLR